MTDPILEINDLKVQFNTYEGVAKVLDGVNISVEKGEAVALVGETGCGKSLTTKSILGLVPTAKIKGEIRFNGESIYNDSVDKRSQVRGGNISLIMQNPMSSLNPVFTIGEQMADIIMYGNDKGTVKDYLKQKLQLKKAERKEAIKKAKEVLGEVQISSPERVLTSYPNELSGGMRQRVLIGMSLLTDPDLLIADEPGTALDVTTEAKILEILANIVETRETSIIYITHDLGVAHEVSDKVNVMYAGQIVEKSETSEMFKGPKHPYARTLLSSVPSLSTGIGEGADGSVPNYVTVESQCRFADRCDFAESTCREIRPDKREVNKDHEVFCHLYKSHTDVDQRKRDSETYIGPPPWEKDTVELENKSP